MPRPKKIAPVEEIVMNATEQDEVVDITPVEEKPPTQILIPHYIRPLKKKDDDEDDVEDDEDDEIQFEFVSDEAKTEDLTSEIQQLISEQEITTKFEIYSLGEHIDTVDYQSSELLKYLELNRAELNDRIEELWQTPSDPNDLIFFNFGEQKLSYNTYYAYFNQNGFAPIEPKIKSWMEYYLNKHNPITPEEVAIQLKGSLQYSFIPIKS